MTQPAPLPPDEPQRLAALHRLRLLDTPPEPLFDGFARLAAQICETPIALVSLVDAERQWFKANVGLPGSNETPREVSFCAHTILGDPLLEVPDALADARFADNPFVQADPHIRFYAGAPLRLPDGLRMGTLCVVDRAPRVLSERQRAMLVELAATASHALLLRDAAAAEREQQALAASERHFRALADSSPFGVFHTNAAGACTYTNASWQQIYGLTLAQSLGDGWSRQLHPQDRAAVFSRWRECAAAGGDFSMEFRVVRPDGSVRHVLARSRPMRGGELSGPGGPHAPSGPSAPSAPSAPSGHVGVVEDITERLLAAQRLRDSQTLLDRAGRLAGVGGWRVDLRDNSIYWSNQTCRIHGVPEGHVPTLEEGIGYYEGDAQQTIAAAVQRSISTGEPFDEELPLRTAQGQRVWVRAVGEAELEDGVAVRLFGAFQDVSARRAIETTLAQANTRLQQLYENTPALLLSIDPAGTVLAASEPLLRHLGCARDQVQGAPLAQWLLDAPEHVAAMLAALFADGRCSGVALGLRGAGGQRREVLLSAVLDATPGDAAAPARALAVLEDVTDIVQRTQQLQREHALRRQTERHAAELDTLLRERSEMLDVLAHEVRQPLNNASAALQGVSAALLRGGAQGLDRAAEPLRRAQAVLATVQADVDNTLAVSSALGGAAEAARADVDVDMVLHIAVADIPPAQRERVHIERLSAARTLWTDASLLRLALRNLLLNALAHAPPASAVRLRLLDGDAPTTLHIEVIDEGSGIEPAVLERLFQRGVRGTGSDRASHGLGLYIVKRVMELLGGSVQLLHTGPQGTAMRLTLDESWEPQRGGGAAQAAASGPLNR
jgi:PAS domain S-box-containing protein